MLLLLNKIIHEERELDGLITILFLFLFFCPESQSTLQNQPIGLIEVAHNKIVSNDSLHSDVIKENQNSKKLLNTSFTSSIMGCKAQLISKEFFCIDH